MREPSHAEVVDEQERDGGDVREVVLAGAGKLGIGEVLEQDVGLAVEDGVAGLDHRDADRLGQVALARAGRAEEESVLVLGDEAAGGEFEDEAPIHLLVEVEVKGVEHLAPLAEAGLFHPAIEEPVLAALELVLDERGKEVDGGELLRLGLQQPWFEAGGHAGAAELAEGTLQLDEVHVGRSSWVLRAMRSRYWVRSRMSGSTWRSVRGAAGCRSR